MNGSSLGEGAIQIKERPWEKAEVKEGRRSCEDQEGTKRGLPPVCAGRVGSVSVPGWGRGGVAVSPGVLNDRFII